VTYAVYDTNVLVSGATISEGSIAKIIDAWIDDEVTLITSQPIITELERTLVKKYLPND
jgi:putative PIN family toxin of toxin-antitoxin system